MRRGEIEKIISDMLDAYPNVSDLNFTVDKPPQVESFGRLLPVTLNPPIEKLTPFQTETIALNLLNMDRRLTRILLKEGSCDCSYYIPGKARFRVNIFSQRGNYSIVMRKLETKIPTIDELKLPQAFHKMSQELNGLILITGATGSGKTTSLAAIINEINETKEIHIVTLEDPVEYIHPQKKATLNQRELGVDFDTFANGLRAALRQSPKVILVGEMRDRETVEIGLSASETGHLVLSTLHTINAGQTINRIIGMFDKEEERQIRIRLSEALRWIVCQRLLPKVGGGRVAAFEIMGTNIRVKDAILNGESEGRTFYDIIEAGEPFGMITFDKHILKLFEEGLITEETAMAFCSRKSVVGRGIDMIKASKGQRTSDIEELTLDSEYDRQLKGKRTKS
jgi:twitching motility protein PilT